MGLVTSAAEKHLSLDTRPKGNDLLFDHPYNADPAWHLDSIRGRGTARILSGSACPCLALFLQGG
jgi:hypothetical protein